jgi:hypothetical protein
MCSVAEKAGCSGTPLPKKLGIKSGHRVALIRPPARGVVREVALPTGLVDNTVCAIDSTWSALR